MFHYIPRHFKMIPAFVFAEMFLFSTVMKIPIDFHILDHCMGLYGWVYEIETTNQRIFSILDVSAVLSFSRSLGQPGVPLTQDPAKRVALMAAKAKEKVPCQQVKL